MYLLGFKMKCLGIPAVLYCNCNSTVLYVLPRCSFNRRSNNRTSSLVQSGWMAGWIGPCWIQLSARLLRWDNVLRWHGLPKIHLHFKQLDAHFVAVYDKIISVNLTPECNDWHVLAITTFTQHALLALSRCWFCFNLNYPEKNPKLVV